MHILINIILSAIAVFVTAKLLPGVKLQGFGAALVVAVVLGAVNAVLRPVLLILTLPINILTLGLFTFVIIGGLVLLVSWLVPGFKVESFWWALVFALVLWLVNGVLSIFK
ncbi:MAG TPA: phage holin family protein [Elusimicrobiales bacterium]|nr:phage holin family protein [Elusimicrobiales bacterium]